jgi:hypothetical protein
MNTYIQYIYIYTHIHTYIHIYIHTYIHTQTTQPATTLSFVLGALSADFLRTSFLFFSGLGFIPGLLSTVTQTLGTLSMLISYILASITVGLSTVKAFTHSERIRRGSQRHEHICWYYPVRGE